MAVLKTHISWTNTTWNPATGCTKVSAGCDFCYAEALTAYYGRGRFEDVRIHPERLGQVAGFGPLDDGRGGLLPRMVFVNSMSDLMHEKIPDGFRDEVFARMEAAPRTIFQVLTKRRGILRRYVEARYRGRGVPANVWLGVSVEDGRVAGRIDALRRLKEAVGPFTAFLSVEPLIGAPDAHDYRGIEQVLIGGESGPRARPMELAWARLSRDKARAAGAAVWMKQFGTWPNNPLYPRDGPGPHVDRVRRAIDAGERLAWIAADPKTGRLRIAGEKGGATLDGEVLHELPPAWHALKARLTGRLP
jgi:protein gp37